MKRMYKTGFTLVELLIVIALIAILSVAVLATINPIEQANKARDARVQNDAAEVMNAYERYYTTDQEYPWMQFTEAVAITVDDPVFYRSDMAGFGICYAATSGASTADGTCNTSGTDLGLLIASDELKTSFAGKDEFTTPGDNNENALYAFKQSGSGGGVYVCYVPKAKSNRRQSDKLYCISSGFGLDAAGTLVKASASGADTCVALDETSASWSTPTFTGTSGMFLCVPE